MHGRRIHREGLIFPWGVLRDGSHIRARRVWGWGDETGGDGGVGVCVPLRTASWWGSVQLRWAGAPRPRRVRRPEIFRRGRVGRRTGGDPREEDGGGGEGRKGPEFGCWSSSLRANVGEGKCYSCHSRHTSLHSGQCHRRTLHCPCTYYSYFRHVRRPFSSSHLLLPIGFVCSPATLI